MMRPGACGGVLLFAAIAASVAAAAAPAAAQGQRAYRDGVKAAEKGDWQAVRDAMTTAIADRAEEKKRYTPHYYLGLAHFELGDCEAALTSWDTSERQGALGKDELAKVRQGRGVCETRRSEQAAATAARGARSALDQAARAAETLRSSVEASIDPQWRSGSPSASARQAAAEERLAAVRRSVEQARAKGDAAGLARGEAEAREVKRELDGLHDEALRLIAERGERVGALRSKADALVASARELLRDTRELEPYPPQVKRKRADLESLLVEFDKSDRDDAYLDGLIARTTFSMQQLKEITASPPRALAKAADSFFAGDYAGTLTQLAALPDDSPRARAHALLLRAAARYYLWVEQGESDGALLAAATADAAAGRGADAGLQPPPALFSPRFVELWNAARPPSAPR
jgi:hypothetical protein